MVRLAPLLLAALLPFGLRAQGTYRCPPCQAPCDAKTFQAPGRCPDCGMPLAAAEASPQAAKPRVAILVFEGVQIIDFAGPYEVFGQAGFDVFTVGEKAGPVATAMGQSITPAHTFATCPKADVLVIPGGNVDDTLLKNEAIREWILARSPQAQIVLSVCNGAFLLARTGQLDGKTSTTFFRLIKALQTQAPKVKVVYDQRFVDNGKFISTAGLSSGLDGALHVIERLKGRGAAQDVALRLEYDWRPEAGFVRAALADQELPDLDLPGLSDPKILRTEGDRNVWHLDLNFASQPSLPELDAALQKALLDKGWQRDGATLGDSRWHFKGREGRDWAAHILLQAAETGRIRLSVELKRAA